MVTPPKWALILGASTGSGAAIARALARDPGLDLLLVHRGKHQADADAVTADCEAAGRAVRWLVLDAGTVDQVEVGADAVLAMAGLGGVQILVHALAAAAVGPLVRGLGTRLTPHQLARTAERMAHSFVWWVQALHARGCLAPSARLLGLSNPLGRSPLPGCAAIAAAKATLEVYVRYLALELGPEGHRVNLLEYGALETHALRTVMARQGSEVVLDVARSATPAGRLVRPDEVGRFVSALAGPTGGWFNGAVIDFTGGEALGHYSLLVARPAPTEGVDAPAPEVPK